MPRIELSVRLAVSCASAPEVRAFLDLDPHMGLNSETELILGQPSRGLWQGYFEVDHRRCEQFAYRIGLRAHVDTEWSLCLRQCELGRELLVDGDRLMISKCWLIGTCGVQMIDDRRSRRQVQGERGPQLVLIPGGVGRGQLCEAER